MLVWDRPVLRIVDSKLVELHPECTVSREHTIHEWNHLGKCPVCRQEMVRD